MLRLYRAPSTKDPLGSAPSGQPRVRPRFRLSRWFGVLSLGLVAVITAASVSLLSWFVSQRMLQQEGQLTRDFVHSLVLAETPLQAFLAAPGPVSAAAALSLQHIARIPDVLRANIYDRERRVIWSSDPGLAGRRFGSNEELDLALSGRLVVEQVEAGAQQALKTEHEALVSPAALFVEIYVPVHDASGREVLGAIEFYKHPRGLMVLLAELRRYISLGAVGFGALLFGALFGLVRRADRIMRAQERRLLDNEAFAVIGEMSSVVAHGIRNPLASIRSSAELMQETSPAAATEAGDIVAQCDRLGAWLREWLAYAADAPLRAEPLSLAPLVRSACDEVAAAAGRRRVLLHAGVPDDLPPVQADPLLMGQVLRSVVANALEALPRGGHVRFDARADGHTVTLGIQDDGVGLSAEACARAGQPMFTTKPQGLGVGLVLARRVLRRHGGQLSMIDAPGGGTRVEIRLRRAAV
jgi:signal transduction histidine kinase